MESKRHILFRILLMECVRLCSKSSMPIITYTSRSGLTCVKCAPGTHFLEDCKEENTNAKCNLCDEGSYTSDYNVATECDSCRKYCPSKDLVPVKNCSAQSNMICGCPEGKFNLFPDLDMSYAVCEDYGPCGPGYGVLKKGTHDKNTTCERCRVGMTFSLTTSMTDKCRTCTRCKNYPVLFECNATHDRVCDTKAIIIPNLAKTASGQDVNTIIACAIGFGVAFIITVIVVMFWLKKNKMLCFKEPEPEKPNIFTIDLPGGQVITPRPSPDPQIIPPVFELQPPPQEKSTERCNDLVIQTLAEELIAFPNRNNFIRELYHDSNLDDADKIITKVSIDCKDGIQEQMYQCCSTWRNRCGKNATYTHLINVLEKGEFKAIANTLRNKFPDKFPLKESTV